jgi:hypothetical protein
MEELPECGFEDRGMDSRGAVRASELGRDK